MSMRGKLSVLDSVSNPFATAFIAVLISKLCYIWISGIFPMAPYVLAFCESTPIGTVNKLKYPQVISRK